MVFVEPKQTWISNLLFSQKLPKICRQTHNERPIINASLCLFKTNPIIIIENFSRLSFKMRKRIFEQFECSQKLKQSPELDC